MKKHSEILNVLGMIEQNTKFKLTFVEDLSLTHPSYLCVCEDKQQTDRKQKVVVKVWRNLRKHALYEWLHRKLVAENYPIPTTMSFGLCVEKNQTFGFTITEYAPYVQAEEVLDEWAEVDQEEAYRTAGEWLKRLHRIFTFHKAGVIYGATDGSWSPSSDWEKHLQDDIDRWKGTVEESNTISQQEKDLYLKQYQNYLEQIHNTFKAEPKSFVLCHRDYHARNWLADPHHKRLTHVIDFEHMFAADPIFDFQRVYTYCFLHNRSKLWEAFCNGYGVEPQQIKQRTSLYLLNYALGGVGYALREKDTEFYKQSMKLLQLL